MTIRRYQAHSAERRGNIPTFRDLCPGEEEVIAAFPDRAPTSMGTNRARRNARSRLDAMIATLPNARDAIQPPVLSVPDVASSFLDLRGAR